MDAPDRSKLLVASARRIAERCPRLVDQCYWAGTSVVALEDLQHRESFDLDFHTREALVDTRPLLAELHKAFPRAFEIVDPPDGHGSGFTGLLDAGHGHKVTMQVMAGFEDVPDHDLQPSSTVAALRRITLPRYVADKVQCVLERLEARDLFDIHAALRHQPALERALRRAVADQDELLFAERLTGWTDASITDDLRAHREVDPAHAIAMRDRLKAVLHEHREARP